MRDYRLLWTLTLFLSSCHSSGDNASLTSAGVRAVEQSEAIAKHTVALVNLEAQIPQSFCSGVIISRDIVLTAAHCFDLKPKKLGIFFGLRLPESSVDPGIQIIRSFLIHPGYLRADFKKYVQAFTPSDNKVAIVPIPEKALNDIAIIRVPRELPESYSPAPLATLDDTKAKIDLITAGFGCRESDCYKESDRLHQVTLTLDDIWLKTSHLLLRGKKGGACAGQSGGPDYLKRDEELRVVGIVGVGRAACDHGISVDTYVPPYAQWITESIEKLRQAD